MESTNEFIWIAVLAISGIIFFECLTKSLKAIKKLPRVVYLIVAVVCGIATMQAVMKIVLINTDVGFMQNFTEIVMRIIQYGFGLIGLLMVLMISLTKRKIVS